MNENKRIQINMSMFMDVYMLIETLKDYKLDYTVKKCCNRIEKEINDKLAAMEKREVYTQSKIAPTEKEQEEARQKYLDIAGIHKDFRYDREFMKTQPPRPKGGGLYSGLSRLKSECLAYSLDVANGYYKKLFFSDFRLR